MTLLYQPRAKRLLLLLGTLALVPSAGCQTSRMAKVPGMGWLGAHKADAQHDPVTIYPAPSASEVPTTISESRAAAGAALVANSAAGQNAGGYPAGPSAPSVAYPETQHTGLPPAPAAVPRGVAPPNTYASTAAAAHPGDAGMPPAASGNAANLQGDVQRGLYAAAGGGSATTWASETGNTPAAGSAGTYAPSGTTAWNANGGNPPQAAASYQADPGALSSRANSDFAPLTPQPAAPTVATVIPAGYDTRAATARNSAGVSAPPADDEFARYDQGAYDRSSSEPQPGVQAVSAATTPIPSSYAEGPAAGVSSPAMVSASGPSTAPATGSHYATIAADQVQSARNGPWRPGSTSRLDGGAAAGWQR